MRALTHKLTLSAVGLAMAGTLTGIGSVVAVSSALAATTPMVTNTDVNLRSGPGTSYSIIQLVPQGTALTATGASNGSWTPVTVGGKSGYMWGAYLTATGPTTSTAATSTATGSATATGDVNVRSGPGTSYTIVGVATQGTKVATTGKTSGGWTEVVWSGVNRWIYSAYLTASTSTVTYGAPTATTSTRAQTVINYALSKVGDAYVWAAAGPNSFDCSGLTMMAYRQVGISLPHHAADQATMGTAVSRANLKPGDLIFWYTPVGHVSIYIGNGEMVHARSTKYGVVRQTVDSYIQAGGQYVGARRYL